VSSFDPTWTSVVTASLRLMLSVRVLQELLIGGTETAATTAEWAMAELMANPSLMKQAREELDAVVGRDRLMQESDLPELPLLQAVVKETFRLHPPTPLAPPRLSSQEAEAWGYTIPAGSQLILNLRAIHRDPAKYENPEEFSPQRFVDRPEVNHLSGYEFHELVPFGVGRRMCPGANLGNVMVHLMLGNLIHGYDWSFPEDRSFESCRRDNREEIFGLTVCRKEPLLLVAKPRNHIHNMSNR
jgi:cytochrome P450